MTPLHRVLVIDDDPDCGEELVELLVGEGIDARLATSTAEADALAGEVAPHLALVDLELGRESGIDLVLGWRVAGIPVGRVVMLSGRSLTAAERVRLAPEEPLLLAKPLRIEALLALL